MAQRILLSLFTVWLGVSGTLTAPLALFGVGFNIISIAHAQDAGASVPINPQQEQVALCKSGINTVSASAVEAQKTLNNLSITIAQEEKHSQQKILDDARNQNTNLSVGSKQIIQFYRGITENTLLDSRGRIVNRANEIVRPKMKDYWQSIRNLGERGCPEYTSSVNQYNTLSGQFNRVVQQTFPTTAAAYKSSLSSVLGIAISPAGKQAILETVDVHLQKNGDLRIELLTSLPPHAANLKDSTQFNQSTGRETSSLGINTDFATADVPVGGNCGIDKFPSYGTGIIKTVYDTLVKPLAALGCLAIVGMLQFLVSLAPAADCLISGDEMPQLCTKVEDTVNRARQSQTTGSLDTPQDDIPTVNDEGEPSRPIPAITPQPGTSPDPNRSDQIPVKPS